MKNLKLLFLLISLIVSSEAFSQNLIQSEYFSFRANCKEYKNSYNSKNDSYSYTYLGNDGISGLLIGVKKSSGDKYDQKNFLDAIKNSGTFDYEDIVFCGYNAIIAKMFLENKFVMNIGFFADNFSYTITIFGETKQLRDNLFNSLEKSFKTK